MLVNFQKPLKSTILKQISHICLQQNQLNTKQLLEWGSPCHFETAIINSLGPASCWQMHGGGRGWSPLSCTHASGLCRKKPLFWRKFNGPSDNVSFDSELALAFEIQAFKVAIFDFFKCQFFKVFRAEWVK